MQLAKYTQNWVQATHQLRAGRMEHAHHSHIVFCRVCGAPRGVGTSLFSLHPPAVLSSPLIAHICTLCAPLPVFVQVTLGITTLLTYVPVSLGAAHQAGALALFTGMLTLVHSLRPASPSAAALTISRMAPPVAVLATAAIATAVTQME
jgi:heme A synthase